MRMASLAVLLTATSTTLVSASCAPGRDQCGSDNAGITLPPGFCAVVVADSVGRARHLTVASNGDVFVALARERRSEGEVVEGGVLALRDADGDGVAEQRERFGSGAGDDVEFRGGFLYFSSNEAVVRYPWRAGSLRPAGPADTIVHDLPATGSHRTKSIAFGSDGALYVNIGSPSNSCQEQDRAAGSPGKDPCDELATRAGIWRFDADRTGQVQADGRRYATGMRNTVALTAHPEIGTLYGVIHGRDQLSANWPEYFDDAASAEKPSEELVRIEDGDDFGWPYCYHDLDLGRTVLAPEYGGDGVETGRCDRVKQPLVAFPAHWAPDGLVFYHGSQFPERYRGGVFIAFHGSWNRAPLAQGGYNLVFVSLADGQPGGEWEVFADGFAGPEVDPRRAEHRPVDVATGPDGSLYVSDDKGGRIYKILYHGVD